MAGARCDFCSAPAPIWSYPAADFALRAAAGELSVSWGSASDWAACRPCGALIECGDRAGLQSRAAEQLAAKYGLPPSAAAVQLAVREAQRGFWSARRGPRRAFEQGG